MKRVVIVLTLVFVLCKLSTAQEVTEKRDLAVFALSYYDWDVPPQALGMVDERIKSVFVNLGRFNVIGMNYRLASSDVNEFIDRIRRYKEERAEIPESVQLGREAFTETDFNRLVGSFLVVVPTLTYFDVGRDGRDYFAELETAFTVINVEESRTIAHFTVRTTGEDEVASRAVREAVDLIPLQLEYEVRKVPEFQLKTGIVDVMRGEVLIEFGENMGVKLGDEYTVVEQVELRSGHQVMDSTGLLVVKDVSREVSVAKIIYSQGTPRIGDQLNEVPRLGADSTVYAHALLPPDNPSLADVTVGIRQGFNRGFYHARPIVGLEVPVTKIGWVFFGFPMNGYFGVEGNIWFGRFQITPTAAGGIGMILPFWDQDQFLLSHLGFLAQIGINYLLGDSVRIFVEAGYSYWFGLWGNSYGGILAGGGIQFRY
ncbi:MAG: hypothetical protein ACLFRY_10840 [Spirochaetia bacterium]